MQNKQKQQRGSNILMYLLLLSIIVGSIILIYRISNKTDELSYNDFREFVLEIDDTDAEIKTINVKPVNNDNSGIYYVSGEYITKTGKEAKYELYMSQAQFETVILSKATSGTQIPVKYSAVSSNMILTVLFNLLPIIAFVAIFFFLMRSTGSGNKQAFDFGKSRARLSREKNVTFKDVAGCDEEKQELEEVIDFLKNPRKYVEIGARIPKGILLFGPPGTGKTLLAKAVAGEANVPFFSISGSDFVEMFVGVGASRVRDLFKTAKENHPCIIFIDEIDAVGRQRGAGLGGGHDEREQTLNQLLVEMDGFSNNSGIIIMAATNRPDVLDPALLRPGRFDRQITISAPDVVGREAILKVHGRNKKFAENVRFNEVAQRIPGFSGAEIENLLNEAALLAARANRKVIDVTDIDEAVDRVMMGPAKKSKKFTAQERQIVAHHEAGHAILGVKLDNANIVQKVTIIPRGQAGGYALMLPEEETFLDTKEGLLHRITGLLGGRVAEEIFFNQQTTGAHNDFQQATKIARAMVAEFGMSDLGPVQYESRGGSVFLGRDYMQEKNFSDQVAAEIDAEVRKIMHSCYEKAVNCINENKEDLLNIAKYLLEIETLTKSDIYEIVETKTLKWWEDKKKRDLEEKENQTSNMIDLDSSTEDNEIR